MEVLLWIASVYRQDCGHGVRGNAAKPNLTQVKKGNIGKNNFHYF